MGKINVYNLGSLGVDLVRSPLHIPDGAWRQAQNAEFPNDEGEGGLKKRGGLTRLNAIALAGSIEAFVNVPLDTNAFGGAGVSALLVALHPSAPVSGSSWLYTANGTVFSVPTGLAALLPATEADGSTGRRAATPLSGSVFVVSYGADPASPTNPGKVAKWDGADATVPVDPITAISTADQVRDIITANGLLYLASLDQSAFPHTIRVYSLDPTTATLTQIGDTISATTASQDFNLCSLAFAFGQLFLGTDNGDLPGRIYRILPGVETTWTLDVALPASQGFQSIATFNGELYVGTYRGGAAALIRKRDDLGVWTTSFTLPTANGFVQRLVEFDSKLFAGHYITTPNIRVYVFDGAAWTEDEDLVATFGLTADSFFGQAIEFDNGLYWAMTRPVSFPTENGSLLRRTIAGAWTAPINATRCLTGALGVFGS